MRVDFGQVANFRLGESTKSPQFQVVAAQNDAGTSSETGFADAFGAWCFFHVPESRETDAQGNITGACEAIVADLPDQRTVIGTRDVRIAKYAQDLKAGEFALVNGKGFRLFFGKKTVALTAGGGFLSFDITTKQVQLVGIPASAGGGAPYVVLDTESVGLVSASGAASIAVKGDSISVSGASVAIDAGSISLGVGASDPVVTYSQLMTVIAELIAQINAHFALPYASAHPGSIVAPLILSVTPGTRVLVPTGNA